MATDWVTLFDLALAQRILEMSRIELARWLDENDRMLREKARRLGRQEALRTSAGKSVSDRVLNEVIAERERGRESEWERHRTSVRDDAPFENARDAIALDAAELDETPLHVDYWGCFAEVFSGRAPPGSLEGESLFKGESGPPVLLLLASHIDQMLRSLHLHRGELTVMPDDALKRLTELRDRCAHDASLRIAYHLDV